jgi:PAS domain-containing protein
MLSPLQRASGDARDGSERKPAEDALRRNEAYLAEAQRLSHTGSFGWHVSSGKVCWTEETFRIFEFETTPSTTLERVFERIHPEDRQLVTQTIDSAARERKNFDFEHRLLMPDGSVKYVRAVGRTLTNDDSGELEFLGAVTEITQRKNVEEALRRSEQQLRDVIETIPAMTWTTDPNGSRDFRITVGRNIQGCR